MIKIGLGLAARLKPRSKLGLQDQNNTDAAISRPKQDHHCKTLANFFSPKTH